MKRFGVKATFFIVGKKAAARKDLVYRIQEEGHLIGNHTYSHLSHMSFEGVFGRRRVMEEIEQGEVVLNAILRERPTLFRPPQGFKNHHPPYYANGHSTSALAEKLLRNTEPGSIVNFHDGWRTGTEWNCEEMARALSKIIEGLRAQGYRYRFVTLDEMVEEGKGKG